MGWLKAADSMLWARPWGTVFAQPMLAIVLVMFWTSPAAVGQDQIRPTQIAKGQSEKDQIEFFEHRVRPILVTHCYSCHSTEAKEIKGGLRLDTRAGWQVGGDSGEPAVIPGDPARSPLIRAVRHEGLSAMPPNMPKLPAAVLQNLVEWVKQGALDPRTNEVPSSRASNWESTYRDRLNWWSLKSPKQPRLPVVGRDSWTRNAVDFFVLARLEAAGMNPADEAPRRTLARRLSFAITGLPPNQEQVERFVTDDSPLAYEHFVQAQLSSPHFGERWARHWMDVVHYSDTHGYEWDAPAKNAWMYRDYLTRSFNADVPINRLILEQIAGDLMEPRVDDDSGLNLSLIGPMALRLGERRHGDSAAVEGVTQEAMANIIDTLSKGFLATTVGCAQCHDHKLDAVSQADYYSWKGVFMSTRWGVRCLDATDPNVSLIEQMRAIKGEIRRELGNIWANSRQSLIDKLRTIGTDDKTPPSFPETLLAFWQRSLASSVTRAEFDSESSKRQQANSQNLKLIADFANDTTDGSWRWDGFGMRHGRALDGELVVSLEGESAIAQILTAGRWSHLWSQRLAGALYSPMFNPLTPTTFSVGFAGGQHVGQSFIVDQAFHSERMKFLNQPSHGWLTLTAGDFDTLEGSTDRVDRRVYLELVTKSLNNYFPPRTGYGGLKASDLQDVRSWFGVTRIYQHPPGRPPRDELTRFSPLFDNQGPWADRIADLVMAAVGRWKEGDCSADAALVLNDAIQTKLLPNSIPAESELARLIQSYRELEKRLQPDRTIGSMSDWLEARDEHIGVRGSYTEFGELAPRGNVRFLDQGRPRAMGRSTGRLELAQDITSDLNPLTARVFVNRVWLYLFGQGLVRTPDDFGHLGEQPTHPELLDYLAIRFMQEGWSLKQLVTLLVTSSTWRQSNQVSESNFQADPENRNWHHMPTRRLEAEAIRDSMLAAAGRLDRALYGESCDPHRTATDAAKRLFSGPVDGLGRRSIYTKVTLMEPPRFFAVFNQPLPKLTTGMRDATNVPAQALTLLNDPLVVASTKCWGEQVIHDGARTVEDRVRRMFLAAIAREPETHEVARMVQFVSQAAALHSASHEIASREIASDQNANHQNARDHSTSDNNIDSMLNCQAVWQDLAHALFNLQEFLFVP